jgi:hypothetical protein
VESPGASHPSGRRRLRVTRRSARDRTLSRHLTMGRSPALKPLPNVSLSATMLRMAGMTTQQVLDCLARSGFRVTAEALRQDVQRGLLSRLMPSTETPGRGTPAQWSPMSVRRALCIARLRRRAGQSPLKAVPPDSLQPKNGVLILSGYGLRVAVERGHLVVSDGMGEEPRSGR